VRRRAGSVAGVTKLRGLTLALPIAAIALLMASCGGNAPPDGWAPPVITEDTYFLFQRKDQLSAIDRESGAVLWSFPNDNLADQDDIDLEAVYGAPLLHDGALIITSYAGEIMSVDVRTGALRWIRSLNGPVVAPAIIVGDNAIAIGTTESRLYVISAVDGAPIAPWGQDGVSTPDGVWAPVIPLEDGFAVATMDGRVQKYALATGSEVWPEPFKISGAIASLSLTPDGRIFVPSLNRRAYLLDPGSGQQIGQPFQAEEWLWGQPAFDGNTAYVADLYGNTYAVDLETMTADWKYETGRRTKSGPVIVGDKLVIADREPVVHFIQRDNGRQIHVVPVLDTKTIRADAVVEGDFAYYMSVDGRLLRADPEQRLVADVAVGRFR
jgi:outer membrane protein assembly factor BamB